MASHHTHGFPPQAPLYPSLPPPPSLRLARHLLPPSIQNHRPRTFPVPLQTPNRTPPVPVTLTLDVNSANIWLACDRVGYNRSSTYSVVHCHSSDCKTFSDDGACVDTCDDTPVPTPTCNNNQCAFTVANPIADEHGFGRLVRDSATVFRRATSSSSPALTPLPRLPIACIDNPEIFKGMSRFSDGILALSRAPSAIQYHVSSAFHVPRKFSICLPSSAASTGAVYFGGGPYSVSKSMVSLPLVVNTNSSDYHQDDPSFGFYVKVISIDIDGSPVLFNSSFLSIDGVTGNGGTLVSSIASYGQLRSEIYKPFVDLFVAKAKAKNVKTVTPPRKEFGACFDPDSIHYDPKTGSGLPVIVLVSEGKVRWRIFGSNSVVAQRGASCLAFVEGKPFKASSPPVVFPAVVIGGTQMEDNLVEFDAEKSKLGVSSSLLRLGTSCSEFKGL